MQNAEDRRQSSIEVHRFGLVLGHSDPIYPNLRPGLALKRAHPANARMQTQAIQANLVIYDTASVVSYIAVGGYPEAGDTTGRARVSESCPVCLPPAMWVRVLQGPERCPSPEPGFGCFYKHRRKAPLRLSMLKGVCEWA